MVYNAMKLFMEINPQLFDDCSHDYTEHQNTAEAREHAREAKWAALAQQAGLSKTNGTSTPSRTSGAVDEMDPLAEDNQRRLDSLQLQDGVARPSHDRQTSVGSTRSQR